MILHRIILATCLQILFSYQSGFHILKFLKYQSLSRFTYQKNKNDYKTEILGNLTEIKVFRDTVSRIRQELNLTIQYFKAIAKQTHLNLEIQVKKKILPFKIFKMSGL